MEILIENMSKRFGGLQALDDVSVIAKSGEVTAIIGPNGSGKSTLVNCITGIVRPDKGATTIDEKVYSSIRPQDLVKARIARTFQNLRLWDHLTCREHIKLALQSYRRGIGAAQTFRDLGNACDDLLDQVNLGHKADALPKALSYGERRRLEIARALATQPALLLLDEPAAGFTLSEQAGLGRFIKDIAARGIAVILIEHHMDLIAEVSSRVTVLNFGRVLTTGTISEVRKNPTVISAYLGMSA